jgi:diguanylate cyclase (GGDEF)-like protein
VGEPKPIAAATLVGPTLNVDMRRTDQRIALSLPTIRVAAGPDMLKFATLYPPDGRVVIGRDATCDLTLSDGSVSRNHAAVQVDDAGDIWVEDLGSTNGTTFNGKLVKEKLRLELGSTVLVGGVTLRLERLSLKELSHLTKVVQRLSLANKDALTGLVTRHFLEDDLPEMLRRHHVSNVPVSAIFLDVDHFKNINDTHGHGVGDEVLRTVGRLMMMLVRESDTCVRYGGEEFLAILPNCEEAGALATAERLRREVERHRWGAYADGLAVTLSAGVARCHPEESIVEWVERADRALYHAKQTGRNKTVSAKALEGGPHAL